MSLVYAFICTKQTEPVYVPAYAANEADQARNVKNAFTAIAGGFRRVGDIVFRPISDAFEDHLLCDGSEVAKASFPQLYKFLGDSQGTAASAENFKLPNYLSGLTFATSAPAQTVTPGGSVVIGTPTPAPAPTGGQTGGSGGNVSSGGRPRNPNEAIP